MKQRIVGYMATADETLFLSLTWRPTEIDNFTMATTARMSFTLTILFCALFDGTAVWSLNCPIISTYKQGSENQERVPIQCTSFP